MQKKINPNAVKIINLLLDGQYHNGTDIGASLDLSRNAVWKIIKKLTDAGVAIDTVKGKGYALKETLILLQKAKIKKLLSDRKVQLQLFERIDSTNAYLRDHTKANAGIIMCLAEQQIQGKGRFNREWYSPYGKNIYLSCHYPFQKDLSELAGLSLVTSLAILKAVQGFGIGHPLCVKWPNDVLFGENKLAGSLIEVQAETHGVCRCIIGIGLNVNMQHAEITSRGWTSLSRITGKYFDRNIVVAALINTLIAYFERFQSHGFADFAEEWMQSDCLANRTITIQNTSGHITGVMQGINERGHILMRIEGGAVHAFSTGDTSIVKK